MEYADGGSVQQLLQSGIGFSGGAFSDEQLFCEIWAMTYYKQVTMCWFILIIRLTELNTINFSFNLFTIPFYCIAIWIKTTLFKMLVIDIFPIVLVHLETEKFKLLKFLIIFCFIGFLYGTFLNNLFAGVVGFSLFAFK